LYHNISGAASAGMVPGLDANNTGQANELINWQAWSKMCLIREVQKSGYSENEGSTKMKSDSSKSGMEELMRLSQRFKQQGQVNVQREKEKAKQRQKVQDVMVGLKDIKISTAVEQLKRVGNTKIVNEVNSLKRKPGTDDLRKLISELSDDLEKRIRIASVSHPEIKPIEHSMKTLTILMDLYFSLK
jgi:acyl-CoA-binding protein